MRKHDPLEILFRLRNLEMENQQRILQTNEQEERKQREICRQSLAKIQSEPAPFPGITGAEIVRIGAGLRHAAAIHDTNLKQLSLAQAVYREQLQKTLQAKQRKDQIEHLLEKKKIIFQHEVDLAEHKLLDEFSQYQREGKQLETA